MSEEQKQYKYPHQPMNPEPNKSEERYYLVIGREDGYDIRLTKEDDLFQTVKSVLFFNPDDMPEDEALYWESRLTNEDAWIMDRDLGRVYFDEDIGEIANLSIQLVPASALTELSSIHAITEPIFPTP